MKSTHRCSMKKINSILAKSSTVGYQTAWKIISVTCRKGITLKGWDLSKMIPWNTSCKCVSGCLESLCFFLPECSFKYLLQKTSLILKQPTILLYWPGLIYKSNFTMAAFPASVTVLLFLYLPLIWHWFARIFLNLTGEKHNGKGS